MTDDPSLPVDPTAPPGGLHWPDSPLPPLERDRAVLAWLHGSDQLSAGATGYLCDALLEWALLGLSWPQDEIEPTAGPDCDHLQVLTQITERLTQRIVLAQPVSGEVRPGPGRSAAEPRGGLPARPAGPTAVAGPRAGAPDAVAGRPTAAGRLRRRADAVTGWAQNLDDLAAATAALLQAGPVRTEPLADLPATMACRDAVVGQLRELVGAVSEAPRFAPVAELTVFDIVQRPGQALHWALSELPRSVPFGTAEQAGKVDTSSCVHGGGVRAGA